MFGFWTGLVGSVCLIIGVLLGSMIGKSGECRAKSGVKDCPAPVELGYDAGLRINGKRELRRGDRVVFEGIEFTVIN